MRQGWAERWEGVPGQAQGGADDCRLVLVVNKADLLPSQASPMRIQVDDCIITTIQPFHRY